MGAMGAFAPVLLQERGHCHHTKYRCDNTFMHTHKERGKKDQEQVREKIFP